MLFNSLDYMLFLAIAVAGYWFLQRARVLRVLLIFGLSCLFYMAWSPAYIALILFSTVLDYVVGLRMHAEEHEGRRKGWLLVSLVSNLGLLGAFKYLNFLSCAGSAGFGSRLESVQGAAGDAAQLVCMVGNHQVDAWLLQVALPVGISFYTFQTLSYSIDIYRRKLEPTRNFFEFAFFVTYFPQLVAGPIVRASEFLPQLREMPQLRRSQVSRGIFLIGTGLVKKVAIADLLSVNLVDRVFREPELYTAPEVVVALYAFTMQMYCDFSGYTDVARGSAMLMGIELPVNFDRPYQSSNPAEFWRRWHMTLSRWLRDYLYFPLGGSRGGPVRAYWNLWLTLFLIGMWHGASWTFVIYGSMQAFMMVIHRFFLRRAIAKGRRTKKTNDAMPLRIFKVFWAMQFVVFSRILFRATNLDNAWDVTMRMFSGTTSMAQVTNWVGLMLIVTFALHYTPKSWFERVEERFVKLPPFAQGLAFAITVGILSRVATTETVPYIYFQF